MKLEQTQEIGLELRYTLEQAVEQIAMLDRDATTLKHKHLIKMFHIGEIVANLDVPYGEKTDALRVINAKTGVHVNQLREWARIWAHFGGSIRRFTETLDQMGKPAEYLLRELVKSDTDPDVLGKKALATRTINRIERVAADLEQISQLAEEGIVEREEYNGLMIGVADAFGRFRENANILFEDADPAPRAPRDPAYMDRVRNLPCCVTHTPGPSDPHHVEQGGIGMKGSDYSVIPLTHWLHREVEDKGHIWLEEKYNVRIGDLIAQTMHLVLFGQKLQIPRHETDF